jgi:hypothetical protein
MFWYIFYQPKALLSRKILNVHLVSAIQVVQRTETERYIIHGLDGWD